ncbi:hypothetical protein ACE1TI_16345 [Alteribacillus sp. JSM 102045]|uniref:hypothetical protein n=1 Tax=Alteribacillus sp. JSM 102045 TaxID=1562101 RepID=UPI0035BEFC64
MKLNEVTKVLENNGFKQKEFMINKSQYNSETEKYEHKQVSILDFKNIFTNKNETEIYLIEEKDQLFINEEVDEFEKRVAGFIAFLGNNPLKYNINLLLLCPLNLQRKGKKESEEINKLISYERNKYYCRKIFLDTANQNFEDEMSLIPSFPIKVNVEEVSKGYKGMSDAIKTIINKPLYKELIKEEPNKEKVLESLGVQLKDEEK